MSGVPGSKFSAGVGPETPVQSGPCLYAPPLILISFALIVRKAEMEVKRKHEEEARKKREEEERRIQVRAETTARCVCVCV